MAAPVIVSVTPAGPVNAVTGTKVVLTVVGSDADAKTTNVHLQLEDGAGNLSDPKVVQINWSDPSTLLATTDDGTPVSVSGLVATVG